VVNLNHRLINEKLLFKQLAYNRLPVVVVHNLPIHIFPKLGNRNFTAFLRKKTMIKIK